GEVGLTPGHRLDPGVVLGPGSRHIAHPPVAEEEHVGDTGVVRREGAKDEVGHEAVRVVPPLVPAGVEADEVVPDTAVGGSETGHGKSFEKWSPKLPSITGNLTGSSGMWRDYQILPLRQGTLVTFGTQPPETMRVV